jgi:hypothetical protein
MKEQLAEQLLARVMNWSPENVAEQRPLLQAMAAYKYDEYQRFFPGQRFIESLALWLNDMTGEGEKELAYDFVRNKLVFFSNAELHHLVSITYPDFVRPRLIQSAATEAGINPCHVARVTASDEFSLHARSCLYLGLSDGARTDVFRRANEGVVDHEQVLQTYEISADRIPKLMKTLRNALKTRFPRRSDLKNARFRTIVLLDDFSASGTSYLRMENGKPEGKISEFSRTLLDAKHANSHLVEREQFRILLVLYIASKKAVEHLQENLNLLWKPEGIQFEILVVHPLGEELRVGPGHALDPILQAYYDERMEDEHTRKGGTPITYGYAACGLPVVLSHNTPNNSIFPLWAQAPKLRPLFPRVSRHIAA